MKYDFKTIDNDTTELSYKDKKFVIKRDIELMKELQSAIFKAKKKLVFDLAKEGLTKADLVIKKQEVIQPIQPIVNYNKNEIIPVFQNQNYEIKPKVHVIQPIQHIVNYNINEIKPMIQNLNYEIKPKVKFTPKQEQIKANPK